MVPKTFSHSADGDYYRWNYGNVEPAVLDRWSPDQDFIYVRGVMVYSFCFETDYGNKIWNCKTGWQEKGML